ncbi:MAG: tetratricopeptide repeat protein [Bacteroidota bacterium]
MNNTEEFQMRGFVLLNQGKYKLAIKEFNKNLAEDPHNAELHALVAFCYLKLGKHKEAEQAAKNSIGIDHDHHFSHYLLGSIYLEKGQLKDARIHLEEALRIAPEEADYHLAVAHLLFAENKFNESWEACQQGLSIDPENVGCLNLKGRLAVKLDKQFDASHAFHAAFAKDPDNENTHANQGWAYLEKKEYKQALSHFRESLRINPNNEFARAGLVEALKAKYWLYRYFLQFSFWIGNLNVKYRWALIIGLVIVVKVIPILAPFYIAFVFFNWFSEILFNTILRFNRFGRYALNKTEIIYSNLFIVLVLGFIGSVSGFFINREPFYINAGVVAFGLMFPLAGTFSKENTPSRNKSLVMGVILLLIGTFLLILSFNDHPQSTFLFTTFLLGSVAYTWLINLIK